LVTFALGTMRKLEFNGEALGWFARGPAQSNDAAIFGKRRGVARRLVVQRPGC
jgi:hypothetical protein